MQDFVAVEVTMDGVFRHSVPRGVQEFTASGLAPASPHIISTRTRNSAGATSPNWVNNTSRTSNYPVPVLHEIIPDNASTGLVELPVTVRGENFFAASSVHFDGGARITDYVSSSELTAHLGFGDFILAGTHEIIVVNPLPGGGVSGSLPFVVSQSGNPAPVLTSIDPHSSPAGTPGLTINLTGNNFVSLSRVCWDGTSHTATYLSPTTLWYDIPTSDLVLPGIHNISVFTPEPLGGMSANLTFTVTGPANLVPTLDNITPETAYAGDPGFTMTVNGTNFTTSSIVRWDSADRETSYLSDTTLLATIEDSDIVSEGTRNVTVFNPSPGGGTSPPAIFTVLPPAAPSILSISPDYAVTGTTVQSRIIGEHFRTPIDVTLGARVNGARYTGSITSYTPIAIDAHFTIPSDAAPGSCNLEVRNADGSSGSLDSAFQSMLTRRQSSGLTPRTPTVAIRSRPLSMAQVSSNQCSVSHSNMIINQYRQTASSSTIPVT